MTNITIGVIIILVSLLIYFGYSKIFPLHKVKIGFPTNKEKYSSYPPMYNDYNSGDGSRDFYGDYDANILNRNIIHDVLNANVRPQPFITPRRWLQEPITVYIKNVTYAQPSCWNSQAEVYLRPWLQLKHELEPLGVCFIALNDEDTCDFPGTPTVFKVKCGRYGGHGGHMFGYFGSATTDAMRDWILDAIN